MRYVVIMIGNRTIEIDQATKDIVEQIWMANSSKDKSKKGIYSSVVTIGGNTVRVDTIRGIFEKRDEFRIGENNVVERVDREFFMDCERWAKATVKERVAREMTIRVFPVGFLDNGMIRNVDRMGPAVRGAIEDFFGSNPRWPRCPAKHWWPIIRDSVDPKVAKFYEVVARNDNAVFYWAKRNGIQEVPIQRTMGDGL